MNKRKIFAFTGIRSEYDLQYSIAKELTNNSDVEFGFIAFGAHLSPQFGETINNIEKDNFKIIFKTMTLFNSDSKYSKAKSAAVLMNSICDIFENYQPDMIILAGDREETIVAATAATYFNIPIAHIFGGDRTFPEGLGNVDEQIRHATTKLAQIHFPSHKQHAKRIEKMGEEPWRIYSFGSPGLDKYRLYENIPFSVITEHFQKQIRPKEYAVVIHHPLTNNPIETKQEFENILKTLKEKNITTFISYPNNDPGNQVIIDLIKEYQSQNEQLIVYKNLPRDIFIPLISNSKFLIGNSSMGLMECPLLQVPAINVGFRQAERINGGNVIFCNKNVNSISDAIDTIHSDPVFLEKLVASKYCYGDGFSGKKIADILSTIEINQKLLAKQITY